MTWKTHLNADSRVITALAGNDRLPASAEPDLSIEAGPGAFAEAVASQLRQLDVGSKGRVAIQLNVEPPDFGNADGEVLVKAQIDAAYGHAPALTQVELTLDQRIEYEQRFLQSSSYVLAMLAADAAKTIKDGLEERRPADAGPFPTRGALERVAIGNGRTCYLTDDPQTWCHDKRDDPLLPVPGFEGAQDVFAGDGAACVIREAGAVSCLSALSAYSVETWRARDICGLASVTSLAVSDEVACAVSHGSVYCYALASLPKSCDGRESEVTSYPMEHDQEVVKVQINWREACLLDAKGRVACWDLDKLGSVQPKVVSLPPALQLSLDKTTSCVLERDGQSVTCSHDEATREVPAFKLPEKVTTLFGADEVCALTSSGRVACWKPDSEPKYEWLQGVEGVVDVDAGLSGNLALTRDGKVWLWGQPFDDGPPIALDL